MGEGGGEGEGVGVAGFKSGEVGGDSKGGVIEGGVCTVTTGGEWFGSE